MLKNYTLNKNYFFKVKLVSIFFSSKILVFFEFDSFKSDVFLLFKKLCKDNKVYSMSLLSKLSNNFFFFKDFFFNSSIIMCYTDNPYYLLNFFMYSNGSFFPNLVGFSIDSSFISLQFTYVIELLNVL